MHPSLTVGPTSPPTLLLRYRDRQYAADLIAAAIMELDLFTWLDANPDATTADIEREMEIHPRPADVLLTLCRACGFIESRNVSDATRATHRLTTAGREHLVAGSPWFLGPYYAPIRQSPILQGFMRVLRTGKPANWQANADGRDWHQSMLDPTFAQSFTDIMNCRGLSFGQALAAKITPLLGERTSLLDVGGGSGIYASTMVAANGQLSATVLEQSPVDAIVRREVARHGLQDRVAVVAGDMFADEWPGDPDVILLSNLLHDWDHAEVSKLLAKTAATLRPGGLLIIHQAFIADDKTGPLPVAEYSALLMNITQGKCYSRAELATHLEPLGFVVGDYHDTIADRGFITAVRH